jgi:hypothetical protein
MADHFWGVNRGNRQIGRDDSVTYGTSTGATDVEVRAGDALSLTRADIIIALEMIIAHLLNPSVITGTKFPPG